jgi:glyoxylase-like metal-dependent hydrolase (beta-lactamase superfamily II)
MFKSVIGLSALAALALSGAAWAQTAPAPAAPPPFTPVVIKPVKPGLYMIVGNGGNSTLRVGDDGAILVDTKNPGDMLYNDLVRAISSVTPLPVKDVVITHVHQDHAGNTGRFEAAGTPVIANDKEKALIQSYALAPGQVRSAEPTITFTTRYTVKIKGATAEAYHFNPAHTGGDTIVYFPDLKVVSSGDEVSANPNVDYPNGGSMLGWQKNLAEIDKFDFDTLIPGHGDTPMTRAQFEDYRHKVDTVIDDARALIKAGTPKDQLIAKIPFKDLGWNINVAQWSLPVRVDAFYGEMSQ